MPGFRCYNNLQFTTSGSSVAPTPVTTSAGTTNYLVNQTVNGCVSPNATIAVVVSATLPTASGVSGASCVGGSTGTILASASGATAPYTYNLNAGVYQTSASFTGLAAGTYTLNAKAASGCIGSVSVVVSNFANSTDNQNASGTNTWIGHMYDAINFANYIGQFTEAETFNETFGGAFTCFNVISNSTTRSIYTETFSVKYRMASTKKGLYVVDLGSDDGSRLTVDGTMVYDNWVAQGFSLKPRVLLNLNGSSALMYEFFEQGTNNQVVFQNLTLVLTNTLSTNTTQTICTGGTGAAISGDIYGTLPVGVALSGTGYQWSYSTTPGGTRTNISGATGATLTPSTSAAPFNTGGTYYVYRKAALSSTNNVSPNPYVATNESNAATITITAAPSATISYSGSPYCSNVATATVTRIGSAGGTYSSSTGLSINVNSGTVNMSSSTPGTYVVSYLIVSAGGCAAYTATANISISAAPAATISYASSPYCSNAGTASVTFNGTSGGTYSSTGGLSIDVTTGDVNLSASSAGTYTITYTMVNGGCIIAVNTSITITTAPIGTFSYSASPYCSNATNPLPTFGGGGSAGTFSSSPGLIFVSTATGQVNLLSSAAGTYTVTNTTAGTGGCPAGISTSPITITALPAATFTYTGTPYCKNGTNPSPAFTGGGIAGTFSSATGLVFVSTASGQINLASSTAGTYIVTNTIASSGGCPVVTATSSVTINATPAATIAYGGSPYCLSAGNIPVAQTGSPGGTYSSTAGLTINSTTGSVTVGSSTAGSYTVTYTIAAAGGCGAFSTTAGLQIFNLIQNNKLDFTNGAHGVLCSTVSEGGTVSLTAPAGSVFINVAFASYGSPGGTCGAFILGGCHASSSQSIVEGYVLGRNFANISATNTVFGDPCSGTGKALYVEATYTQPICAGTSPGTITGTDPFRW